MVYYSFQARNDLKTLFDSLLTWETHNQQTILTYEFVVSYHNDILEICETLDKEAYNRKAVYRLHKQYGEYIFQYKRNSRTSWYIIYNKKGNDVYIERIVNNYKTI